MYVFVSFWLILFCNFAHTHSYNSHETRQHATAAQTKTKNIVRRDAGVYEIEREDIGEGRSGWLVSRPSIYSDTTLGDIHKIYICIYLYIYREREIIYFWFILAALRVTNEWILGFCSVWTAHNKQKQQKIDNNNRSSNNETRSTISNAMLRSCYPQLCSLFVYRIFDRTIDYLLW